EVEIISGDNSNITSYTGSESKIDIQYPIYTIDAGDPESSLYVIAVKWRSLLKSNLKSALASGTPDYDALPLCAFQLQGSIDLEINQQVVNIPTGQVDPATIDGYAIATETPFIMSVTLVNNQSEAIFGGVINFYRMTYDDYNNLGTISSPDDLDAYKIPTDELRDPNTLAYFAVDYVFETNESGYLAVVFEYDASYDDYPEILMAMWQDGIYLNGSELAVVYDYTGVYVSSSKSLSVDSTVSNGSLSGSTYYLTLGNSYSLVVDGTLLAFTELPALLNEPIVGQNVTLYLIKLDFYNDIIASGITQELQYTYFSGQYGSRTSEFFNLGIGTTDSNGQLTISVTLNTSNSASGTWYVALVYNDSVIAFEPTLNLVIYSWPLPQSPLQPLENQTEDILNFGLSTIQLPIIQEISFSSKTLVNAIVWETLKPQSAKKILSEVITIR
ncbi:MAG: hypothetical protein ACTSYA_06655, partial [Candidatus Kariarchaeaceae archaeon]